MRNDNERFSAPYAEFVALESSVLSFRPITGLRQTEISGDLAKARSDHKLPIPTCGAGTKTSATYALAMRRDRMLVVNGPMLQDGWHDSGYAVSDMSSAHVAFEFEGSATMDLLSRGTDIDFNNKSAGVARRFRGFDILLYQANCGVSVRLHIGHGHADTFYRWVQGQFAGL